MKEISSEDYKRAIRQKKNELGEIKEMRELIANGNLRDAGPKLYALMKKAYGERCVRNWAFRQYASLSKDNTPTELGVAVGEFLAMRDAKKTWWA